MANISITRISSKGQIVIPLNMREDIREGDEFIIIKDENRFILKKASSLNEKMKEDLEFARRTEEAYKRHEAGGFIVMEANEFIKEMKKW